MKYTVLMVEGDFSLMISLVDNYLDKGWSCQGGIAVEKTYNQPRRFYQAMIKN